MKKVVRLTENDLVRVIKRVIKEASAPEPVVKSVKSHVVRFQNEGQTKLPSKDAEYIKRFVSKALEKSIGTIERFYKSGKFPKIIKIGAGTTSRGSYEQNAKVGKQRIDEVVKIVKQACVEMGFNDAIIQKFLTVNTDYKYYPSALDQTLYDKDRKEPLDSERIVYIEIATLETKGLEDYDLRDVENQMRIARGYNINPDEEGIANAICKLETFSDIVDLHNELQDYGGLESFINQTITAGYVSMTDDTKERNRIVGCLNNAARNSGRQKISGIKGDKIDINIGY